MKYKRKEPWGYIEYNTLTHKFSYEQTNVPLVPYSHYPVLLNVYITMECNMACSHCVTQDFLQKTDLVVTNKLVEEINKSEFLVVVITGGEPLLTKYTDTLLYLLNNIKNKGIIIDTNGINIPNKSVINSIINKNVLLRVSLDAANYKDEIYYRHLKPLTPKNDKLNKDCYELKIANTKELISKGVNVAIQTVVSKRNKVSVEQLPRLLRSLSINKWYLQRFIPSYEAVSISQHIDTTEYFNILKEVIKVASSFDIECIVKKDRRHNSVVMIVGDGQLYTQGERPGEKVFLGNISENIDYFEYISTADHAERYYGI